MIVQTRENKDLVIPKSLGNFVTEGSGGSGITPEEAAEIASAVTADMLDDYDAELQVELEDMRDAISANTTFFFDVDAYFAMGYEDRRDYWDLVYSKIEDGARVLAKGTAAGDSQTVEIPLIKYKGETDPSGHLGGWLYFSAKAPQYNDNPNLYFSFATSSVGNLNGLDSNGKFESQAIYTLPTASSEVKGGVRIGSGLTMSGDVLSVSMDMSGVTADIAAVSAQTSANTQDIGILSAVTSGLAASVSALSGSVKEDVVLDIQEIEDMTYANRKVLWDEVYAKIVAGHRVYVKGIVGNNLTTVAYLPLEKYIPETDPSTHLGGFLYFSTKDFDKNKYLFYSFSSDGYISGTISGGGRFQIGTIYSLQTASSNTLGGVKIGSGLTMDNQDKLSVKIGDGLGFSGDTLVVSGISGGGIEKVQSLPATAEEGDIVWLEGHTETGYTITMDMSEKDFEAGYLVATINGNDYYCYGSNYGTWVIDDSYNGARIRYRRDGTHRYFDFITDETVALGSDADSIQSSVEFPFLGDFYAYEGGEWRIIAREVYVDYDKAPETAKAAFIEIYSGLTDFDGTRLVILHKFGGAKYQLAFKPYLAAYYGMDCQSNDARGTEDGRWGQIRVDMNRLGYDWENDTIVFDTLAGTKWSITEENIPSVPSVESVAFGNGDRGGLTYDADNEYFIYDSNNVATGDTNSDCEDLIDYNFLTGLFNRNGRFESYFLINANTLDVISGGTTYHYTNPTLLMKDITSYTIGEYTYGKEVTFKYADWELKIDILANGGDGQNRGANLRINAL